ncbi:hypothetical protein C4577_01485 [Candidatus Parcubacteria bacterium]|nr:MAG: hypothetical protein C4577_01485 [Candidatus Parcubacteria bacterium]
MKGKFNNFRNDNLIKFSFIISLVVTFLLSIMIYKIYSPPYIPFFNSLPWGEKRLVESSHLMLFPASFFLVIIFNNLLSFLFYDKYTLISRILCINTLLFVILGFFAYLQILILIH